MDIDFNNVRKQAAYSLDDLIQKLNGSILKNKQYAIPNGTYHKQEMDIQGYVLIDAEDIQQSLDDLRFQIASICLTYEPKSDKFKDVMPEIEENGGLGWFNPEEDED